MKTTTLSQAIAASNAKNEMEDIFGPVISSYTRAQAIEDGELVDVSNVIDPDSALRCPFRFPVAMTRAAWAETIEAGGEWVKPAEDDGHGEELRLPNNEEVPGRLHDLFFSLQAAIRIATRKSGRTDRADFAFLVDAGNGKHKVDLYAVTGPGDRGEPVITIMLPDED